MKRTKLSRAYSQFILPDNLINDTTTPTALAI